MGSQEAAKNKEEIAEERGSESGWLEKTESVLGKVVLAGALITGAVVGATVILPAMGIGGEGAKQLAKECCTEVGNMTGAAGAVTRAVESVPLVGNELSTNVLAPGFIALAGHGLGMGISHYEEKKKTGTKIGAFLRVASLALGAVLALPMLLPGIGHAVQFFSRLFGSKEFGLETAKMIGNNASCTVVAGENTMTSAGTLLLSHMACVAPAVLAGAPMAHTAAETKRREQSLKPPSLPSPAR